MNRVSPEIIRDFVALEALEPEWWNLWGRCPGALPFQSPAWLIPWWRHFSPGSLFVLAVRRGDTLVGLAPGYIEDGPLGRRILPLGISLSDHLDILVDPECAEPTLTALVAAADSHSDAWDVWELEELPLNAAALGLPLPDGWGDQVIPQTACPILPLLDEEGARSPLPRAKRRQLQLARNRAGRRGDVRIEHVAAGMVVPALEELFRLHRKRWEARGGEGVLAAQTVRDFLCDAAPRFERAGLLRLYLLRIAGQIVAAYFGLVHKACAYFYLTGFDPEYDFESPGALVLAHAIERAAAEGCRDFDFLRGGEAYKYEWGAVDRWNVKRSIRRRELE